MIHGGYFQSGRGSQTKLAAVLLCSFSSTASDVSRNLKQSSINMLEGGHSDAPLTKMFKICNVWLSSSVCEP